MQISLMYELSILKAVADSPGELILVVGPRLPVSESVSLGVGGEFEFPTSSGGILMLLVWGLTLRTTTIRKYLEEKED